MKTTFLTFIFLFDIAVVFCSAASSNLYYNQEVVATTSVNEQQITISQQDADQTQTEYGIAQLYKQHLKRQQRSQPATSQSNVTSSSATIAPRSSNIVVTSKLVNTFYDYLLVRYLGEDNSVRSILKDCLTFLYKNDASIVYDEGRL